MTGAPANSNITDALDTSELALPSHDMEDGPVDLARWPNLAPVLVELHSVAVVYKAADESARKSQLWHSRVVIGAAILGAASVLAALWQLAGYFRGGWGTYWEFILAVGAFLAVVLGIVAACHHKWIRERFRAEQCRFIKFDYLLHPQRWRREDGAEPNALQRALTTLEDAKKRHWLHRWIRREVEIFDDLASGSSDVPPDAAEELVSYYSANRLEYQLRYFERQADVRERQEFSWILPPLLFFVSVGVVFVHFALEVFGVHGGEGHFDIGKLLIVSAVALPIVGATIRTYRTAHEFGRNANRFHAVANELRAFRAALGRADGFAEKLRVMENVETALKNEHRAWIRLMIEAEWFG